MGSLFHCWPNRRLFLDAVLLIQIWTVLCSFQAMGVKIVDSKSTFKPLLMSDKEIQEEKRRIWNNFNPLKPLAEFFDRLETINHKGEEVKKKIAYRIQGSGIQIPKQRKVKAKTTTHQEQKTEKTLRNENHDVLGANDESRRKHILAVTDKTDILSSHKDIRFLKPGERKRVNDKDAKENKGYQTTETTDKQPSNKKKQQVGGHFTTDETSTLKVLKIGNTNNKKETLEPKPHSPGDITFLSSVTRTLDGDKDKGARTVDVVTGRDRRHGHVEHNNPEKTEADTRKTQGVENNLNRGALEKSNNEETSDVDKHEEEYIKNKVESSTTKNVEVANDDEGVTDKVVDKTLENAGKKHRQNRLVRREAHGQKEKGDQEKKGHKKNEQGKGEESKKKKGEEDKNKEYKENVGKDRQKQEDFADGKDLEVAGLGYIMFKEKEKDKEKDKSEHGSKKNNGGEKKAKALDGSKFVDGLKCEEEKKQNKHRKKTGTKHRNGGKGQHHEHKKEMQDEFKENPKALTRHISEEVYEVRGMETGRRALRTHGYNHNMSNAAIHILVVLGICLFGFILLIFVFAKTRSNTNRVTRVNSQTALYEPHTKYDKYDKFEY